MFRKNDKAGYREVAEGVRVKTLVHGERTLMAAFSMEKGKELPLHEHPHEQSGYLVSGRIRLTTGGEQFEVQPGDSWCIPGNVAHGAEVIENSLAIEVFSPVREDYLS